MNLEELKKKTPAELISQAEKLEIENPSTLRKQEILFVVILTIYHFFLFQCLRKFAENDNSLSSKFYRIINEIPTVLLIGIILVVVFKPI